jgi:dethiobiotin synthetase
MNRKTIIIAGIGTGVGKTIIAAMLTEALEADYWKPIQSGSLNHTDTDEVRSLVTNPKSVFHQEAYRLTQPLSPHAAAEIDSIEIELTKLGLPQTDNTLVIELAGGIMVPLNKNELNIDLLVKWQAPVLLVSQNYLGSINHTLLSVEALKNKKIEVAGIIFNGDANQSSENFILQYTGLSCLARINHEEHITKKTISRYAHQLKPSFVK